MNRTSLVLLAHGSRDPRWRVPFDRLREELLADGAGDVRVAFLEFGEPRLPEVVEACVEEGSRRVLVLPMFLGRGRHVDRDLPVLGEEIRARHRDLELELLPPVGEHPEVIAALGAAARDAG